MRDDEASGKLLTIGELGRRARLTPKALRLYDEKGLLSPVEVDGWTGYRRYHPSQVEPARLIGLLRGVDMPLAEIGRLLADIETDRELAARRLADHLGETESRQAARRTLARHIQTVLQRETHTMFEIQTRDVPARRVMSMQRRLRSGQTDAFVDEAKAAFAAHLNGADSTGPFTLIFHGRVDEENDGPLEAILGCPSDVAPSEAIGIRTEPAHEEAFTPITKAQWAFPAILAAYDAVAASPEAAGRPSSLSCREVYLAEPDAIGDDELICDVAFPIGEPTS
jgi:DNA-binding transcriptional MerR regulator